MAGDDATMPDAAEGAPPQHRDPEAACEAAWARGGQAEAEEDLVRRGGGEVLTGASIRLFSRRDGIWKEATCETFQPNSGRHRVRFVDGSSRSLKLSEERWLPSEGLPPAAAPPPPPPAAAAPDHQAAPAARSARRGPEVAAAAQEPLPPPPPPPRLSSRPSRAAGQAASLAAARTAAAEEAAEEDEDDEDSRLPAHREQQRKDSRAGVDGHHSPSAAPSGEGDDDGDYEEAGADETGDDARGGGRGAAASGRKKSTGKRKAAGRGRGQRVATAAPPGRATTGTHALAVNSGEQGSGSGLADDGPAMEPTDVDQEAEEDRSSWVAAGDDLPGWHIEKRIAQTGRQYSVYRGPDGLRATSRIQALAGGVRRGAVQKPMEEMSVRELISERTQGVPMAHARVSQARKRSRGPNAAEDPGEAVAGGRRPGSRYGLGAMGVYGGIGAIAEDAEEARELRAQQAAEEEALLGPRLAGDDDDHDDEESHDDEDMDGNESEADADADGASGEMATDETPGFTPQLRIVNGQIVLDEESLHVTAQPVATERLAAIVEEDMGAGVTSASYLNRSPSMPWSKEETEAFLSSLRKYGTDFTLIAALFPNRDRRQIKNKFKREEKLDPGKIDRLLASNGRPDPEQMQAVINGQAPRPTATDNDLSAALAPVGQTATISAAGTSTATPIPQPAAAAQNLIVPPANASSSRLATRAGIALPSAPAAAAAVAGAHAPAPALAARPAAAPAPAPALTERMPAPFATERRPTQSVAVDSVARQQPAAPGSMARPTESGTALSRPTLPHTGDDRSQPTQPSSGSRNTPVSATTSATAAATGKAPSARLQDRPQQTAGVPTLAARSGQTAQASNASTASRAEPPRKMLSSLAMMRRPREEEEPAPATEDLAIPTEPEEWESHEHGDDGECSDDDH